MDIKIDKNSSHPLQSTWWGKFREKSGNRVIYFENGIMTLHKLPFLGRSVGIFVKGGSVSNEMIKNLREVGKKENLIFIKLEPNIDKESSEGKKSIQTLKKAGAVEGETFFTPTTFVIDLDKSEEELMKSFHSKTRYNIRLSEKKGVSVVEDNSEKAFGKYLDLMEETVTRDKFYAHNRIYHKLMWESLRSEGIARLLVAKYKKEIIAAWVLFVWKDGLYYPYGASGHKHKNLMASNLMMWEAIKLGKRLGLKKFDLWGREPGKGFTKFKEGYNPRVLEFVGTWDLVIDPMFYKLYLVLNKIRWIFLRTKSVFIKPSF